MPCRLFTQGGYIGQCTACFHMRGSHMLALARLGLLFFVFSRAETKSQHKDPFQRAHEVGNASKTSMPNWSDSENQIIRASKATNIPLLWVRSWSGVDGDYSDTTPRIAASLSDPAPTGATLSEAGAVSLLSTHYLLLTTHYSLLITHSSLFTTHYSLLTTHYSLLTAHYSLLTTHYSLLTPHYSLLTAHYSLLTTHYSLLTTHYLVLTTHYSPLTTHYPLHTTHYSLLTTHYALVTAHYSLLTAHYSLLTTHYPLPTTH